MLKLFELYNLSTDVFEQDNLTETNPEKLEEMIREWEKYKNDVDVKFLPKNLNTLNLRLQSHPS